MSSAASTTTQITEFLDHQISLFPEASDHYTQLKILFEEKLWHQLSNKLGECLRIPFFRANQNLLNLWNNFVHQLRQNFDLIDTIVFSVECSKQFEDSQKSLDFLNQLNDFVLDNKDLEAWMLLELEKLQIELDILQNQKNKSSEKQCLAKENDVKDRIDKCAAILDGDNTGLQRKIIRSYNENKTGSGKSDSEKMGENGEEDDDIDYMERIGRGNSYRLFSGSTNGSSKFDEFRTIIPCAYYRIALQQHKYKANSSEFFDSALMFLTYLNTDNTEVSDNSSIEKNSKSDLDFYELQKQRPSQIDMYVLASDLALAALIGPHIFNFGELLQHPIIKILSSTKNDQLAKMLLAFDSGRIDLFEEIFGEQVSQHKVLEDNKKLLFQKIRTMKLMQVVFERPTNQRSLDFELIKRECRLNSIDDVELLLIDSMCSNLIRGSIDQIEQKVYIEWIRPRILNQDQLSAMRNQVQEQSREVDRSLTYLNLAQSTASSVVLNTNKQSQVESH